MQDLTGYGAVLQTSPLPLQVVGYFYEKWPHGKRNEIYRVEVTKEKYDATVKRIKRHGGTMKQKDEALFNAFQADGNVLRICGIREFTEP